MNVYHSIPKKRDMSFEFKNFQLCVLIINLLFFSYAISTSKYLHIYHYFPQKRLFIQTPWRTLPYPIPEKPFGVRPKKA